MSAESTNPTPIQPKLDEPNSGLAFIILFSILAAITTIFVALRFFAKRLTHQTVTLDDYLCLAALLPHHALMIASCVRITQGGMGQDLKIIAAKDPDAVVILLQTLFVAEITYSLSSPLIKLSVLAFLWRIFPTRTVQIACKIIGAVCIAWAIPLMVVKLVQCRPLRAFWHIELQVLPTTKCLDTVLLLFSNSIVNTVIDLVTIVLPIQEVVKLKTSTPRKMKICFVFFIGGIAFAASLVRTISTAAIWRDGVTDLTNPFVVSGAAAVVEIYAAIMGACLPLMMPVYRKVRYGDTRQATTLTLCNPMSHVGSDATRFTGKPYRKRSGHGEVSFDRLDEEAFAPTANETNHYVSVSNERHYDDATLNSDSE